MTNEPTLNGHSADPRDPDGNVSGLDTARRIHFSSRLTNDPTRSTTSADSFPPDGLDSALPADTRPDRVDNVGGLD